MSVRYGIKCPSVTKSVFFFKYRYVSDTFPFFIGTICILIINYCYIHVKGAFVWYILSFDKILFQSLSSKISCFILSVRYQILSNEKVYLWLKYWWLETDVVQLFPLLRLFTWYQKFFHLPISCLYLNLNRYLCLPITKNYILKNALKSWVKDMVIRH